MADDGGGRRTRSSARVAAAAAGGGAAPPPPPPARPAAAPQIDGDDEPASLDAREAALAAKLQSFTAPKAVLDEVPEGEAGDDQPTLGRGAVIADREDEYKRRRLARAMSPARVDAFAEAVPTGKNKGAGGGDGGGGGPVPFRPNSISFVIWPLRVYPRPLASKAGQGR